jgi:hypothetical protein
MTHQDDILRELQRRPIEERLAILEAAIHEMRASLVKEERRAKWDRMRVGLAESAEKALPYYENDEELTAFTALDSEDFLGYEQE